MKETSTTGAYEETRGHWRRDPERFWRELAVDIEWVREPEVVLDDSRAPLYRWCIGQDAWRHVGGHVCTTRPVRADQLDALVWDEVRRLLEDPALVQAEIDRRLQALRPSTPRRSAAKHSSATSRAPTPRSPV